MLLYIYKNAMGGLYEECGYLESAEREREKISKELDLDKRFEWRHSREFIVFYPFLIKYPR